MEDGNCTCSSKAAQAERDPPKRGFSTPSGGSCWSRSCSGAFLHIFIGYRVVRCLVVFVINAQFEWHTKWQAFASVSAFSARDKPTGVNHTQAINGGAQQHFHLGEQPVVKGKELSNIPGGILDHLRSKWSERDQQSSFKRSPLIITSDPSSEGLRSFLQSRAVFPCSPVSPPVVGACSGQSDACQSRKQDRALKCAFPKAAVCSSALQT